MGNLIDCLNKNENIDNIIGGADEICKEDFFNLEDNTSNHYYSKNDENSKINQEIKIDNKNNFNIEDKEKEKNKTQINNINNSEHFKIYNIKELDKNKIIKIKKLLEIFNNNGKPRASDDFSHKNWIKFYPLDDPYFNIKDFGIIHNQLKIYNSKNINDIKLYIGDLNKDGQRHGIGKYITSYYVLIGMWKNDVFSGWGRESRCNGDVFEGRFENEKINGKGIFLDRKKNKYIGDFVNSKRWGKGKWVTNKIIYEGDFNNNQIDGNGKIKFLKSGIEYIGSFKNGTINGYGIFKWINGDKYEGEVKNGKMDGKGKYIYNNGKIINGIFYDGQIKEKEYDTKTMKNKNSRYILSYDKFDYKRPYRTIDMDTYTFDESRAYINNYMDLYDDKSEGEKLNIYRFNSKKNKLNNYCCRRIIKPNKNYTFSGLKKLKEKQIDETLIKSEVNNINTEQDNIKKRPSKSEVLDDKSKLLLSNYRNYGFGNDNKNEIDN